MLARSPNIITKHWVGKLLDLVQGFELAYRVN
jgi:hypothetical protein